MKPHYADVPAHLRRHLSGPPTGKDHEAVWRVICERHLDVHVVLTRWMMPEYLEGLRRLDLDPRRLPSSDVLNERLRDVGWRVVWVNGFIPPIAYVGFLARRIFPIGSNVRSYAHRDYSPTPDMIHDVFGHLPMLFTAGYRDYLERLARAMLRARRNDLDDRIYRANVAVSALVAAGRSSAEVEAAEEYVKLLHQRAIDPSELTQLGRMFLWSIEFGLLGAPDDYRLLGAGLLSSPRESHVACSSGAVEITDYSIDVIDHDIHFSDMQMRYYVAPSYERFHEVLDEYVARMAVRRELDAVEKTGTEA
jgi:phenylalanine-4-hydroxylase